MTVSVTLDPAEQEWLAALAKLRQQAPHELMREAIRQYLDREEGRASSGRRPTLPGASTRRPACI
jgi:predicted transcriptional regulator